MLRTVRIGTAERDLDDVRENPGKYASELERAKKHQGFAECGCKMASPRPKLVIRAHGTIFILARWPEQAHLHDTKCPFHVRKDRFRLPGSREHAFQCRDGQHNVRLDLALRVAKESTGKTAPKPSAAPAPSSQRSKAGLLAFLEYAWEAANLNFWPGHGHRGWGACWSALTAELSECRINGQAGALRVMRRWDAEEKEEITAEFDAFLAGVKPGVRRLIIGEIASVEPSQYGFKLFLRQNKQPYFLSKGVHDALLRSHAPAMTATTSDAARCIALLAAERNKNGYLTVADAAAMLANSKFLPCDSSHEITMADHLIAAQRAFVKPTRHVGRAPVHPDFVLTDTAPETVIEVLGMSGNPDYDRRIAEKREYYRANRIPFVEWVPDRPVTSVPLPPPADGT